MSVLCDMVWQDTKDGYNWWECTECGAMESEEVEDNYADSV